MDSLQSLLFTFLVLAFCCLLFKRFITERCTAIYHDGILPLYRRLADKKGDKSVKLVHLLGGTAKGNEEEGRLPLPTGLILEIQLEEKEGPLAAMVPSLSLVLYDSHLNCVPGVRGQSMKLKELFSASDGAFPMPQGLSTANSAQGRSIQFMLLGIHESSCSSLKVILHNTSAKSTPTGYLFNSCDVARKKFIHILQDYEVVFLTRDRTANQGEESLGGWFRETLKKKFVGTKKPNGHLRPLNRKALLREENDTMAFALTNVLDSNTSQDIRATLALDDALATITSTPNNSIGISWAPSMARGSCSMSDMSRSLDHLTRWARQEGQDIPELQRLSRALRRAAAPNIADQIEEVQQHQPMRLV